MVAGGADLPTPEIFELTATTTGLGPGRTIAWLACGAVVLGAVVGLGLAGRLEAPVGSGGPASGDPPRNPQIVILLPASGEVILGGGVPVAGRMASGGPPRGATPTVVHVVVADETRTFGETDLPVVGGRFAGWVRVTAPVRGRVVEVRAWDPRNPSEGAIPHAFVLGPSRQP